MSKLPKLLLSWLTLAILTPLACQAQDSSVPPAANAEPALRELFVPFQDLSLILGSDAQRVFMTRQELEELKRQAQHTPDEPLPQKTVLLSADYQAELQAGRAVIQAEYQIEVLASGLHALPLKLNFVGIRRALLDGQPARLWPAQDGVIQVILTGRGLHTLQLELTAPVSTAAAQQGLVVDIPTPPATRFHLSVPGNVEMKSGASIIKRRVDDQSKVTHFDIVPAAGQMNLVMSLNNKQLRDETTLLARGVLISEVTSGYQRLHTTLSMNVLHGAADEFRVRIPDDYEVTQVATPLLARWRMEQSDSPTDSGVGMRVLVVNLRELATDQVVIQLRADRLKNELGDWSMPRLEPLSVAGFAGVVGLLLEEKLAHKPLQVENLIAIDNQVLTAALPPSVLATEPGTPRVRPVATYYATDTNYQWKTTFAQSPARVKVAASAVLTVSDRGLDVEGSFTLTPETEKLFAFDFALPQGWTLTRIAGPDGQPLAYESQTSDDQQRFRARLATGLAPQLQTTLSFQATITPQGWLSDWTEQSIQLPRIISDNDQEIQTTGAIAVRAIDDLKVQPAATNGLIVISDQEKAQYGCAHVPVDLAWRYTTANWQGDVRVTRKSPRIVGRVYSFLQTTPDALIAHYELVYDVDQARMQRLQFSLPASTPSEITVRGLSGVQVKESSSQLNGDRRQWTIVLAEKKTGRLPLTVDFVQPLSESQLSTLPLPDVITLATEYQSGLVAVEGHPELDVVVQQHPRSVDMGELVDAVYQPGKRLLGVYSYTGNNMQVTIQAQRRQVHGLPTTIVQRAALVTLIGTNATAQTAARYSLRTKAQYIDIQLPAGAELWTIMVDDKPSLPERQADRIVVSLPVATAHRLRDLRVVYEQTINTVDLRDRVDLGAPSLWQRAERDAQRQPVPTADLSWEAILPTGFRMVQSGGSVVVARDGQPRGFELGSWFAGLVQRVLPANRRAYATGRYAETTAQSVDAYQLPQAMAAPQSPMSEPGQPSRDRADLSAAGMGGEAMPQPPIPPITAAAPSNSPIITKGRATWAIEGLRCLDIDLTSAKLGHSVQFGSLGVEPDLSVTLINEVRWQWLGAGCGLGLFLIGLLYIPSSLRARIRFAALSVLAVYLVALITDWQVELSPVIAAVIISSIVLILVSLVAACMRALFVRRPSSLPAVRVATPLASVLMLSCALASDSAQLQAQELVPGQSTQQPGTAITTLAELATLIDALPDHRPLVIPSDAIVVPYDPAGALPSGSSAFANEKILVPYETYLKLWQAAHPDAQPGEQPPVVPYAWSDASYNATLDDRETLTVRGQFTLESFGDAAVTVPLALGGGVLESLLVDGQPAKVQLVEANTPVAPGQASVLLLYLTGKGTKQLSINVRMKVERRGGWRVVEGRLPWAPATRLSLTVARAESEVRLQDLADRPTHEIQSADQIIETSLHSNGLVNWQWRTKIAETTIDQGLSVDSKAVFDIQEDGLHFIWHGNFQFRSGRRESFNLLVPGDYLVEKVVGANLRGWDVQRTGEAQQLTIDLLAAATQQETLTVHLVRNLDLAQGVGNANGTQVTVPGIEVPDAMLQRGELTIRRSRLLDVRSTAMQGLSRIDTPDNQPWLGAQSNASPLPLDTFQAFQFSQVPYRYDLNVQELRSNVRATGRTVLSLSQLDSSLETQLTLTIQQRPIHHLRLHVPANWQLSPPVLPLPYEWTLTPNDQEQVIDIYLASGASGWLPLVLRGRLEQNLIAAADGTIAPVPLPKIQIDDVQQQSGDIVVTSDPAYVVRADNLVKCETGLMGSASSWLTAQHQQLAQLLVHYGDAQYSGQLVVTQRTSQVKAFSVSNIKLTDRSIEETLYFEFQIRTAGVRQLSVVVPAWMANAKVRGPLIRSHAWTPLNAEAGAAVRLQIELQEDVMGQYSLILEKDRLLVPGEQQAAIPIIETGSTEHRFVTLENSGRDELIINQTAALDRLQRSQSQWNVLARLLGGKTTEAFVVNQPAGDSSAPELRYSTKDRTTVETVGARIGIAQTLMVVDENGTYRASQELRMENRTEQYLEIELPEGAQLWTASVAGEAVKPMTSAAGASTQRIRLPLVKTAAGDLDYPIVIKYGGQVDRPGGMRTTRFPLARTINVNVELSQVRLRLPPGLSWWNFGGSMSRVPGENELKAGWIAFRTKQLMELTQMASKAASSDFSRARAINNIKELGREVQSFQSLSRGGNNDRLQESIASNSSAWFEAEKELQKPAANAQLVEQERSNRFLLNERVLQQSNVRSYNVANSADANFSDLDSVQKPGGQEVKFNEEWLAGNALKDFKQGYDPASPTDSSRIVAQEIVPLAKAPMANNEGKPQLPAMLDEAPADGIQAGQGSEDRKSQVYRYQQRLEQNSANRRTGQAPAMTDDPGVDQLSAGMGNVQWNSAQAGAMGPLGNLQQLTEFDNRGLVNDLMLSGLAGGNNGGYLASLDTDLPNRGDEYLFTTPRGATEITVQSVSMKNLTRWLLAAGLAVVGLIFHRLTRRASAPRRSFDVARF